MTHKLAQRNSRLQVKKELYRGLYRGLLGVIKGHTRSLDYSSIDFQGVESQAEKDRAHEMNNGRMHKDDDRCFAMYGSL